MAFDPNAANVGPQAPSALSPTAQSTAAPPPPAAPTWYGKGQYQGTTPANFDAIQNGQAVAGAQGLNWYHTGALGGSAQYGGSDWIQAPAGFTGSSAAGGPQGPQSTSQAVLQPGTVGGSTAQGQPTTVASSFQQALINRLNPTPVSDQSPEIAPAIAANKAAEQRGMEHTRSLLAERAASQGLDQNAFNSQLLGAQGESAGRQGNFAGQATLGLAQQRAQDITSALSLAGSSLSDADRQALQKQLADLQAQVSRESIAQQATQGQNQFTLGQGQLNLGLLNALLGNQQFGQNLGAQLGMFNSSQNNSTLQGLLGALGG